MPILRPEVALFPPNLFESSEPGDRPWRVARVRSRQEKALARHLCLHGVPFYLPLAEKQVRRGGRRFASYLPLFPGYLFFRGLAADRTEALRSNVVVTVLEAEDQAQLDRELRSLRRLEETGATLVPHPYLAAGDEVRIVEGALKGWTGTVLREKGKLRLVVSVSFLRQSVAAELDREVLAPLPASQRPRLARAV